MKSHVTHFIILALLLIGGVSLFSYVQGNQYLELAVGILVASSYVAWGILHHALMHDLHHKVVIEYVLVGSIAILVLLIALGS
ncbi:MAG: hypothetical protein Q7S76_01350 [bacterium]|nr:hypothetical protein [bacterium]